MNGLIIKESLADISVLELVRVTRTETWKVSNAAADQPAIWTAISFETEDSQAEAFAEKLSQALKMQGWYINASTAGHVYVIFSCKVFKYPRGDAARREEVKRYGRSAGVPESQLDWSEE